MTQRTRLKVGLVCPYNIIKGGGVQEGIIALRNELERRGHKAKILTPLPRDVDQSAWPNVIFIGSATDIRSPFATTAQVSMSFKSEELEDILRNEDFDILHFHEPWVPMMSRQLLSRSTSINIGTFHARLPDTVMSKTIEAVITPYTKPLLKYLDCLSAVSDAAAEYVTTLTNETIEIIPNGIDLKKYKVNLLSPISNPRSSELYKTILFIGRLEKRKGVKYLLKALQELQNTHPDTRLIIAGDGVEREKLEQYATHQGITNVEFMGFVDEETKTQLLREADVFCSSALYGESFGIVLLEAMAMNLPTVAGDNPGYKAVLQGSGKLSLIDPKNTHEFANRLQIFLYDEELRKLWQNWAAHYVKNFDYPKIVDKYEALYIKLLKNKKQ